MKSLPHWIGATTVSTTSRGQGRRDSQACAAASRRSRCTQTKSALPAATSASARSCSGCPSPPRNTKANHGLSSVILLRGTLIIGGQGQSIVSSKPPNYGSFRHKEDKSLACYLVVVDERRWLTRAYRNRCGTVSQSLEHRREAGGQALGIAPGREPRPAPPGPGPVRRSPRPSGAGLRLRGARLHSCGVETEPLRAATSRCAAPRRARPRHSRVSDADQ